MTPWVKNFLVLFYFVWFAIGGILLTGLWYWLSPASTTINNILITGSVAGIIAGGLPAFFAFLLLRNQFKNYFGAEINENPLSGGFYNRKWPH